MLHACGHGFQFLPKRHLASNFLPVNFESCANNSLATSSKRPVPVQPDIKTTFDGKLLMPFAKTPESMWVLSKKRFKRCTCSWRWTGTIPNQTQHTSQSRKSTLHLTVNSVNVITAVIPLSNQPPIPLSQLNTSASAKCSKEILLKTPDPGRSGEASGTKASESDSTDSNKFRLAASVGALDCDSVSPDRQSGGKWDGN